MTNNGPRGGGPAGHDPYDSPGGTRPVEPPPGRGGRPAHDGDLAFDGAHAGGPDPREPRRDHDADSLRDGRGDHATTTDVAVDPVTGADQSSAGSPIAVSAGSPSEADIVSRTRTSGTWVAVIVATLVLIVLLVFILQNLGSVTITFLGLDGTLPLGVALLFAAIAGALLVALTGAARILQLRRRVHRTLHRDR